MVHDSPASALGHTQAEATPLYDVFVRMPAHADANLILHMATEKSGLPARQIELLLDMLKCVPSVRIGASVTEAKAEQVDRAFTEAGLMVKRIKVEPAVPELSLAPLSDVGPDGKCPCPACGERVVLTDDRRCPACEVYVDRVDTEAVLRKRLRDQEQLRLRGIVTTSGDWTRGSAPGTRDSRLPDSRLPDSRLTDSRFPDSRITRSHRPSRPARPEQPWWRGPKGMTAGLALMSLAAGCVIWVGHGG